VNHGEPEVDQHPTDLGIALARVQRFDVERSKQLVELQDQPAQVSLRVDRGNDEVVRETAAARDVERDRIARLSVIEQPRDAQHLFSESI
jgi:hypothetical protein